MLTTEQEKLKQAIAGAKFTFDRAKADYQNTKAICTHVYQKDGDSAVCAICEEYGGWWCPDSNDHVCQYTDGEGCDYCGQPEERQ
jgi:hypothetical protein